MDMTHDVDVQFVIGSPDEQERLRVTHLLDPPSARLEGALDRTTLPTLILALRPIGGEADFSIDLGGVTFSDVGSLRALVVVAERFDDGRHLLLRKVPAQVRRLLGLTGWHAVPRLLLERETCVGIADGATAGPNGSAPRCEHADRLPTLAREPPACRECQALGWAWTHLVTCLTCGWVACIEETTGNHAREHYRETDHPVVSGLEPGATWRWCYVHRRNV